MTELFSRLAAAVQVSFTADTAANSAVLSAPSTTTGLFVGLPVFGANIPRGALITSLSPLTLSIPATSNALAQPLTTGFLSTGRRLIPWQNVTSQPALFLRGGDDDNQYPNTILQELTMHAEVWIYSRAGEDPSVAPESALNNLIDCVQAAFAPDDPMRQRFTLGGLVYWCRLVGRIEKTPGDLDGQAVAVADVEIIVP